MLFIGSGMSLCSYSDILQTLALWYNIALLLSCNTSRLFEALCCESLADEMLLQEYLYDKETGGLEDAFLHNFIIPVVWRILDDWKRSK